MRFRSPPRYDALRRQMVERQIRQRGIGDERVLEAMRRVPRHEFVPLDHVGAAYADGALPIGHGATISQPYIVAIMTACLELLTDGLRVLEIGTGSGYQAAVLAACGCEVFSVERVPELHVQAAEALRLTGFGEQVRLALGDGSKGWPGKAPFDRILITAAAADVPAALVGQLVESGVLVAPIGDMWLQMIRRYRKQGARLVGEDIEGARFVPLVEDSAD